MALAPPGETIRPSYPKTPSQTKETKCQILVERAQRQNKTLDLPHTNHGYSTQVGCCVKSCLLCWRLRELFLFRRLRELPSVAALTYMAFLGAINGILTIRFDSNSYPIGIDCHASSSPVQKFATQARGGSCRH
jgi:hypothetical protein